jgi:hypothetical protein
VSGRTLAAALLIPLDPASVADLAKRLLVPLDASPAAG